MYREWDYQVSDTSTRILFYDEGITGFIATINSLTFPDFYMLENYIIFPDQMDLIITSVELMYRKGDFYHYLQNKWKMV